MLRVTTSAAVEARLASRSEPVESTGSGSNLRRAASPSLGRAEGRALGKGLFDHTAGLLLGILSPPGS